MYLTHEFPKYIFYFFFDNHTVSSELWAHILQNSIISFHIQSVFILDHILCTYWIAFFS